MSEASLEPPKLSRLERALQFVVHSTTVPTKGGGGIVFPNGFPGVGYRLDEWQFDRYRAGLAESMLGEAARRRFVLVRWVFLFCFLGMWAAAIAMNFFEKAPDFDPRLHYWPPRTAFVLFVVAMIVCLVLVNRQAMRFTRDFRNAPRVSRQKFIHRRFLGALVAQDKGLLALHLWAAVPFALALFLIIRLTPAPNALITLPTFALPVTIYALWRFVLLLVYWSFRIQHDRSPTIGDLKPVKYPAES